MSISDFDTTLNNMCDVEKREKVDNNFFSTLERKTVAMKKRTQQLRPCPI